VSTVVETYYDILGVSRDATPDEIRAAYRRLAKQNHPDVNPDPAANERFIAIQQAYETLIDPDARVRYDMVLDGHPGFASYGPFRYSGGAGGETSSSPPSYSWSWQVPDSGIARVGFLIFMLISGVLLLFMLVASLIVRALSGNQKNR
jgi:curved DNA-binding protein CbpA